MSLSLQLDAPVRLVVEPGYRRSLTAGYLAQYAKALDSASARTLWAPPGIATVQLKPLQLFPEFLNHQAQLDLQCVVDLPSFFVNPSDLSENRIFTLNIGSTADPWIAHVPAGTLPPPTKTVIGIAPVFYSLQQVADQSEAGLAGIFDTTPVLPNPVPNELTWLAFVVQRFAQNQGWLFRWWVPAPIAGQRQSVYAFVFAQYCALCRGALLEVYEDTSLSGDRSKWIQRYRESIFVPGRDDLDVNHLNPEWTVGRSLLEEQEGHFASLMAIPVGRQKVLFLAHTGQYIIATVRAHPRRTLDGAEWDVLRSDSVSVWALTPTSGYFQVQRIKYPSPVATLSLPDLTMDYTPLLFPSVKVAFDADAGSQIVPGALTFPKDYTFPSTPLTDDCPAPTNLASVQQRTFGERIRFVASPDLRVSPQLYSLELVSEPSFMNNPAVATSISDQGAPPTQPHLLQGVEVSLGLNPGEGRLVARLFDSPGAPLSKYWFRSEMPVQLYSDTDLAFTGYTDRIEVQPHRTDTQAPVEMRLRCLDRWLLLESTFLREQRDWQKVGHISVVDNIARQCGIDTGPLHADGSLDFDGAPMMSGGSMAEYPAGWDGALSSSLNTPLGTPILTNDNLEGNQLLGWKPTTHDTGATFLKRITELFSNWLVGFRADGTFYYLPYNYFTQPLLIFHAFAGRAVTTGLHLALGVGLTANVSPGTAMINGTINAPANIVTGLAPNATNTLYLLDDGTVTSNTTGMPPPNSVTIGTATTDGTHTTAVDDTASSPRQTPHSRIFRHPVEYRTIEPSGNFVYVLSHYQLDQTANRSGIFVDWASIRNPKVVNYLGRIKWFPVEIAGAFSCAQLNRMAYIAFQSARRRRVRVSFDGDFVPALKVGQVFTLEGIGNFKLIELRATHTRRGWQIANYVGELVEKGYGLPS